MFNMSILGQCVDSCQTGMEVNSSKECQANSPGPSGIDSKAGLSLVKGRASFDSNKVKYKIKFDSEIDMSLLMPFGTTTGIRWR